MVRIGCIQALKKHVTIYKDLMEKSPSFHNIITIGVAIWEIGINQRSLGYEIVLKYRG
jgi:hypothetical protein